jgi:putative phosphoesterase
MEDNRSHKLGVISDTHGLLRPEALDALRGTDLIIHAGDVGEPDILTRLGEIAPTVAVRGNVDRGSWARRLNLTEVVEAGDISIYLIHDLAALTIKPKAAGIQVVVFGHSHQPEERVEDGVLYLNPGSAGPRRFSNPVCLALLTVSGSRVEAKFIPLL